MSIDAKDNLNPGVACDRCEDGWRTPMADPSSVYPCKTCRPDQFFRWAEGHYNGAHLDEPCDVCTEARGTTYTAGRRKSRRKRKDTSGDPGPTPPPDTEREDRRYGTDA